MTKDHDGRGDRTEVGRIAVVIPALNAAATIGRQIRAVLADRDESVEVVLVDNGSTDATAEVMRDLTDGHERVIIVHEPRRGVNRARNAGIAATDAPMVLMCDADDEIEPGWIAAMRTALESFDLVGGSLRPADPIGELIGDARLPFAHDPFGWGIPYGWGANCGVRREVWNGIGGFDPNLDGGGDEADLFLQTQIAGATFAWVESAVVRYTERANGDAHRRRRWLELLRNPGAAYWYGRLNGWPRAGHLLEDTVKCALLLPLAPFSAHWRSVLQWRATRRLGRLRALRHLPDALRQRRTRRAPRPLRFAATRRLRRDWRRIDGVEGWLTRSDAAILHAAASRVGIGEAIVEIGSWKGRSTTALALGCRGARPVYAVDPHTGDRTRADANQNVGSLEDFQRTIAALGLDCVVPMVARSEDAAAVYDGPPVGLLFIDGWHSTEAVLTDHRSWAPHLAPGATVVFHDGRAPQIRSAINALRAELPRRMLEIDNTTVCADW